MLSAMVAFVPRNARASLRDARAPGPPSAQLGKNRLNVIERNAQRNTARSAVLLLVEGSS
jgi:hypothetical protein